ncbi:MAG: hypothetical protein IKT40_06975 [Bacilli bacterium]|jgi:hypothetical protein|nr:hypothetical protein [Bacilli bacterium]
MQNLQEQYRPLSPWAYFWLQILYAIPILGIIFLIIHAIGSYNINRRNFARSYFCIYVIIGIILIVIISTGAFSEVLEAISKK